MKKQIVAIIISLSVVVCVVLFGQIFNLSDISVQFENQSELKDIEIIEKSGISTGKNIFILSKSEIKNNIEKAFSDNSVAVTRIEKFFPDSIVITVKKRFPLFALSLAGSANILPTDLDFHLNTPVEPTAVDYSSIVKVIGIEVTDTLDTEPLRTLRRVASAFMAKGFNEDSFKSFFETINIDSAADKITVKTRNYGGTNFLFDTSGGGGDDYVLQTVSALLDKFYALPEQSRSGVTVSL